MFMSFRRWTVALVASAATLAGAGVASAQTIDTRTGEYLTSGVSSGFGQTFTAPAGATTLTQFSFWLSGGGLGLVSSYEAYLMQWNGSMPVGEVLYSSGPRDTPECCPQERVDFTTGELTVTPGAQYVAFLLSTSGNLAYRRVRLDGEWFNSYDGGASIFAYSCGDDTAELLSTCQWAESNTADIDNEFVATFESAAITVPEPSSIALLVVGAAALIAVRRTRRHA